MKSSELEGDSSIVFSVPGRKKPAKEGIKSVEGSKAALGEVMLKEASSEYSHTEPVFTVVLEGLSCLVIGILSWTRMAFLTEQDKKKVKAIKKSTKGKELIFFILY